MALRANAYRVSECGAITRQETWESVVASHRSTRTAASDFLSRIMS